jgi:hypothetical protein
MPRLEALEAKGGLEKQEFMIQLRRYRKRVMHYRLKH